MPQPSQWNWPLSSSSNSLQVAQKYADPNTVPHSAASQLAATPCLLSQIPHTTSTTFLLSTVWPGTASS